MLDKLKDGDFDPAKMMQDCSSFTALIKEKYGPHLECNEKIDSVVGMFTGLRELSVRYFRKWFDFDQNTDRRYYKYIDECIKLMEINKDLRGTLNNKIEFLNKEIEEIDKHIAVLLKFKSSFTLNDGRNECNCNCSCTYCDSKELKIIKGPVGRPSVYPEAERTDQSKAGKKK